MSHKKKKEERISSAVTSSHVVVCDYLIKNHVIPSAGSDIGKVIESRVIV
jgi:hypothetical protein